MESIPSRENRKATVCHDSDVSDVPDSRPGILAVHGGYLGIDCREKTVALENFGRCGRKNALREDHDGIVLDARPCFMISHSRSSQLGSGVQDLKRRRPKLAGSVVTAVN